jgi:hypothetical protein
MATASQADITLTGTWTDAVVTYASAASVDVLVQKKGTGTGQVFFGGSSAPASDASGIALTQNESVSGNAAHIWVRGAGSVSVNLL